MALLRLKLGYNVWVFIACRVKLADGEVLKWDRLRVGEAVTLYGRTFHIVGCDSATRELFRSRGMELPPDEAPEPPKDQEVR